MRIPEAALIRAGSDSPLGFRFSCCWSRGLRGGVVRGSAFRLEVYQSPKHIPLQMRCLFISSYNEEPYTLVAPPMFRLVDLAK